MMRMGVIFIVVAMLQTVAAAQSPASQPVDPVRVRRTISDLRRESITPPASADIGSELTEALKRLRLATTARRRKPLPSSSAPATSRPATSRPVADSPSAKPLNTLIAASQPTSAPARQVVTPQTLAKLRKAAAEGKIDPEQLADALFATGQLESAYAMYALAQKSDPQGDSAAWLLFQMGNCLRRSDPPAAGKLYGKVISEHSESTWAQQARMQIDMLQWYARRRPDGVLKEVADQIARSMAASVGQKRTKTPTAAN